MHNLEIDAPWLPQKRVYLDIASFQLNSGAGKGNYTPQWVVNMINKMWAEFDFIGLTLPQKFYSKKIHSELVGEIQEHPIENWNVLLEEEMSILLYLGQPSDPCIIATVNYAKMFPFTGDAGYLRSLVYTRVGQTQKIPYTKKTRFKKLMDWFK